MEFIFIDSRLELGHTVNASKIIEATLEKIQERSLQEGGFALYHGKSFRPDATAWAVLALEAFDGNQNLATSACRRLARGQLPDGRLPIIEGHPESYWPTSLALLAWTKIPGFEQESKRAAEFLLTSTGFHQKNQEDAIFGHDTSIKGWPWIENTHSWIEPTSLAVLALKACGHGGHHRVHEAIRMILDRQLPAGGWNYGNTFVFGKELPPIPESTGCALCALAGNTELDAVRSSLNYLNREVKRVRTPLALSWSIFGLTAWSNSPSEAQKWVLESLNLQNKYGNYDTTLLSQLIIAYFTCGDLLRLLI